MEPSSANYTVMIAVFLIWGGIFFYLFALDKKVKRLEKAVEKENKNSGADNG